MLIYIQEVLIDITNVTILTELSRLIDVNERILKLTFEKQNVRVLTTLKLLGLVPMVGFGGHGNIRKHFII